MPSCLGALSEPVSQVLKEGSLSRSFRGIDPLGERPLGSLGSQSSLINGEKKSVCVCVRVSVSLGGRGGGQGGRGKRWCFKGKGRKRGPEMRRWTDGRLRNVGTMPCKTKGRRMEGAEGGAAGGGADGGGVFFPLFYSNLYFSSETNVLCLLIVR